MNSSTYGSDLTLLAQRFRVTGIVQGVGFRPFVWRLAQDLQLTGWVLNDALGVEIAAQGSQAQLEEFRQRLSAQAPPLARVDAVQIRAAGLEPWTNLG